MGLPWVRLDSNIATHDKMISLLAERDGVKAAWMYVCSLGYAGGHETDGVVSYGALPHVHGTKKLADLAVAAGLWVLHPEGWVIHNWAKRQQTALTTARRRAAQSNGARKANCTRFHGPDCHCYKDHE